MLRVVFQDCSLRDRLQYFIKRDALLDHFPLSMLGDTYVIGTSLRLYSIQHTLSLSGSRVQALAFGMVNGGGLYRNSDLAVIDYETLTMTTLNPASPLSTTTHQRRRVIQPKEPDVVLPQGDVPEGVVVQVPIDPARDVQFRSIDFNVLVP